MNRIWNIVYYETENGQCEVLDFINSLKDRDQAKILSWLKMLEEKGPNLPRPYADILTNGIHELRIKLSGNQVRILYFFCYKDFIILTNNFMKNTNKVPNKEIRKAEKLRNDFLKRYTEKKLRKEYDENI